VRRILIIVATVFVSLVLSYRMWSDVLYPTLPTLPRVPTPRQRQFGYWLTPLTSAAMERTVPAGVTTFKVSNTGKEMHNFEIEGNGIEKRVGKLNPGETKTLLVELKPGTYEVYCPVPGHKSHGMSLDLTVR